MPTYAELGGWVISTIAGWFVVTADRIATFPASERTNRSLCKTSKRATGFALSLRILRVLSMCLAPLERSRAGEGGNEAGGALGASSCQRSEDFPGSGAFWSFVAAGDFARDHRRAQLTFGQIVSGLDAFVIQKGKEMIALFMEPIAHSLLAGFAARRLQ